MRVTVLTGGTSMERDVAIASAGQVVAALRAREHQVSIVDTARGDVSPEDEPAFLSQAVGAQPPTTNGLRVHERDFLLTALGQSSAVSKADVLFLALHGGWGEDGTLQSLLEVLGTPYTGSGPLASAVAMDKDMSKQLFRHAGVATADWLMAPSTRAEVDRKLGWPVIVKPSKQGSTVGLSLVDEPAGLAAAIDEAARFDDEVMIEAYVPGREVTVGILGGEALSLGEIIPQHQIFDYQCKYTPGMSQEIFPADLDQRVSDEVRRLALTVHQTLKLGGYSRVDFRLTPPGQLVCLEANTLPGLTATSLLPQSARASGIEFADLCERVCDLAVVPESGELSRPGPTL
ncbi:MAG: D-alanine--D-alanine ligase [Gemmatimonadales bacterium]